MHRLPGGRLAAGVGGLLIGLVGLAMLGAAIATPENRILGVVLGVVLVAVAWLVIAGGAARARSDWSLITLEGKPAWAVQVGSTRGLTTAGAVVFTTLGVGFAIGAVRAGNVGAAVIASILGLFMLVLGVEFWRIVLLRRPELRISPDLVQFHGPGIDSELAWDDVGVVKHEHLGTRWGALVLTAVTGAPSYRWRLSRLLLPMDREPDPPGIHVRFGLIPDEAQLRRVLRDLYMSDRAQREALISRGLPVDTEH